MFQYVDEPGNRRQVGSEDVNEYLHQVTGREFTAKDFRTWAGTVLARETLQAFDECDTQAQARKNIVQAVESVEKRQRKE